MAALNMSGVKAAPYWWEDAPREKGDIGTPTAESDLIVVGSGYTGLSAALVCAEAGMSVTVIDKDVIGFGCSSRNGGSIGSSIKPELDTLTRRHGATRAAAIRKEGMDSVTHLDAFIRKYGIDCDWSYCGRYAAAHTPAAFEMLKREAAAAERLGDAPMIIVPREEQLSELGSSRYFGGAITPGFGGLQPAKLHSGVLAAARRAGVALHGGCEAVEIGRNPSGAGQIVRLADGRVLRAGKVLVATNGYSGNLLPWVKRRVIPIATQMLATEKLSPDIAHALVPNGRMVLDTRKLVLYFRLSPDGKRMVFGGRASITQTDPIQTLPRLYEMMLSVYPQLAGTRVTHAWSGTVAYTFDELPHLGQNHGIHYCMGYCGSGVTLSIYYGTRMGRKLAGLPGGETALDGLSFQTRPLYNGRPWFLPMAVGWYAMMDKFGLPRT